MKKNVPLNCCWFLFFSCCLSLAAQPPEPLLPHKWCIDQAAIQYSGEKQTLREGVVGAGKRREAGKCMRSKVYNSANWLRWNMSYDRKHMKQVMHHLPFLTYTLWDTIGALNQDLTAVNRNAFPTVPSAWEETPQGSWGESSTESWGTCALR